MRFEWDPEKARKTKAKRGISFEQVELVFLDPYAISRFDAEHLEHEDRYIRIGRIAAGIVTVAYTDRADVRRIISARKATRGEKEAYYDQ